MKVNKSLSEKRGKCLKIRTQMLKGESEKRVWKKFVVKCKSPPAAAARMVFTNTWHQNYYKIALASEILNIFHGQVGDTDEKGRRLNLPP